MAHMSGSMHLHAFAVAKWKEAEPSEKKVIIGTLLRKDLLRIGASAAKGQPFPAASFDIMYDDCELECEHKKYVMPNGSSAGREHEVLDLVRRKILAPEFRASGTANLDEVSTSME